MKFKKDDREFLQLVCKVSEQELHQSLCKILHEYYDKIVETKDYIYAIGTIPVCLIAHMDTVFDAPPTDFLYDKEQKIMWSPQGAGFDDRAGIYIIIRLLLLGYRPHIIFTHGEEVGGMGAQALIAREPKPFADIKYIIQLDRSGQNDCVFYQCDNLKFQQYVESFGFKTDWGSYTDISFICPAWGIAGVNLSVGYEYEHSHFEMLFVNHMLQTCKKVQVMLDQADMVQKPFKYISKIDLKKFKYQCSKCNQLFEDYQIFNVLGLDGTNQIYCPNCIIDNVEWCTECLQPFEIDPNNPKERVCKRCKYKKIEVKHG